MHAAQEAILRLAQGGQGGSGAGGPAAGRQYRVTRAVWWRTSRAPACLTDGGLRCTVEIPANKFTTEAGASLSCVPLRPGHSSYFAGSRAQLAQRWGALKRASSADVPRDARLDPQHAAILHLNRRPHYYAYCNDSERPFDIQLNGGA